MRENWKNKARAGYWLITHLLVGVLTLIIGIKLGTNLTFQQLIGLTTSAYNANQAERLIRTEPPITQENVDFSLFWETWNRLERDYYDLTKLDAQKMVYGAIAGMTSAIGDPYTVFLTPETKKRLDEDLQGEFGGVGIQLGYRDNQLAVIAPLKDHPAQKAGVKAGEYILKIKDELKDIEVDTIGMSAEEAVNLIRGQKGTAVTLTLALPNEDPRDVELVREIIEIPSVELEIIEGENGRVAHVVLSRFGDKTMVEWEKIVNSILQDKSIVGIILDMRNNPGGYLEAGIDLASEFVDGGIIVSQQGRQSTQHYRATRQGRLQNYPVVVLVNKGSASASEIVAGALRDRRNTVLIGEQTFGKGTVQDAQKIGNNGAGLNITIARWLLPSGQSIQDSGLPVDIEVVDDLASEDRDEAVEKAQEELYNRL
jgi:carboxyl-terminal processing protease